MVTSIRNSVMAAVLALVALACTALLCTLPAPAFAAVDAGVYTAAVSATYENPDTGVIEDSGGEANAALGASMVSGIMQPQALVEKAGEGNVTVTLRLYQADMLGDFAASADTTGSGAFGAEVVGERVQQNADTNMVDVRFTAPSEDATIRCTMYVEPMGRSVIYFVKLGGFEPGNAAGFVQTLDEASLAQSAAAATESASASAGAASAGTASASSAAAAAEEAAPQASAGSASGAAASATGAKEYNGDGKEVTGAKDASDAAEGLNYPLIIGVVVALVVIIALVAYFAVVRPKNAAQAKAAAAAASRPRDGE